MAVPSNIIKWIIMVTLSLILIWGEANNMPGVWYALVTFTTMLVVGTMLFMYYATTTTKEDNMSFDYQEHLYHHTRIHASGCMHCVLRDTKDEVGTLTDEDIRTITTLLS